MHVHDSKATFYEALMPSIQNFEFMRLQLKPDKNLCKYSIQQIYFIILHKNYMNLFHHISILRFTSMKNQVC